jgi:hypothetical protein
MKKIYVLLVLNFLLLTILNAQSPPFQWADKLGSNSQDESSRSIATDGLGNVYVAGLFGGTVDFDPGAGTYNLTSIASSDIFFAKYNSAGAFVWARQVGGGSSDDTINKIFIDASLNVFIAGSFRGTVDFDPGAGVTNLSNSNSTDLGGYFAKYDNNGNLIWAKAIVDDNFGTSHQTVRSIAVDNSGNSYITGGFGGTTDFDPGAGTYTLTYSGGGGHDIFVGKYDSNGNFSWAFKVGTFGAFWEIGKDIRLDATGNCYVTGTFFGSTTDFDPGAGVANPAFTSNHDVFIAKYTSAGAYVWAKGLTGGGNAGVRDVSLALDGSGNIYVTGDFDDVSSDYDPGASVANLVTSGNLDVFFCKYDNNGNFIYAKSVGGTGFDFSGGIYADNSGQVFITGSFQNTVDFDPGAGVVNKTGNPDGIFMNKYDANGNYVWANMFTTTLNTCCMNYYGADITSDGVSLFANGNFAVTTGDFNPGAGVTNLTSIGFLDAYFAKYDACVGAPSQPAGINGNISVCSGSSNTYSVALVSGASSYGWSFPGGWTGTSTSNIVTTTVSSSSGNVTVTANNNCGTSTAQTLSVTVITTPGTPGAINGSVTICSGNTPTYSVAPVSGATSYTWSLPGGWTGSSATNIINTTANATSGNVTVTATNACGTSAVQTLSVTVNTTPGTPGTINGNITVCSGSANTYSIATVAGATSYNWSLPSGWTGSSSTNIINSTASATSGNVTITATNACGTSALKTLSVTVNTTPAMPGTISGNVIICAGSSNTYSIATVVGATSYTWTKPGGWTGTSGTNILNTIASATSGNLTVTATNSCGTSPSQTLSVTVNSAAVANAGSSQTITCSNPTVSLSGSGVTTFTWSGSGIVSGGNTANPIINTSGTYSLVGSTSGCNSNTATVVVSSNTIAPTVSASTSNSIICGPPFQGTATLTASGASTYTWNTSATTTAIAVSPSVTTNYTVTGTNASNGCTNTTVFTQSVSTCTGLNQITSTVSEINIYPNPTTGIANLVINEKLLGTELNVYNLFGEVIYTSKLQRLNIELNLNEQANGVYFIRIGSQTKKIIKE